MKKPRFAILKDDWKDFFRKRLLGRRCVTAGPMSRPTRGFGRRAPKAAHAAKLERVAHRNVAKMLRDLTREPGERTERTNRWNEPATAGTQLHDEKRMSESDWKTFRKMVPELRERYLEKTNEELKNLLLTPDQTPTERFWNTYEKITKEAKILHHCLDGNP